MIDKRENGNLVNCAFFPMGNFFFEIFIFIIPEAKCQFEYFIEAFLVKYKSFFFSFIPFFSWNINISKRGKVSARRDFFSPKIKVLNSGYKALIMFDSCMTLIGSLRCKTYVEYFVIKLTVN